MTNPGTTTLASLGHAWGGPTWLLLRPDGHVIVRIAFDETERQEPFSGLDEDVGILTRDGRLLCSEGASPRAREMVYRAKVKGRRLWRYSGERWEGRAVWERV